MNTSDLLMLPPYVVALWSPQGIRAAWSREAERFKRLGVLGVVLHCSFEDFAAHGAEVFASIRATLPNVDIWYESEGDEGPANAAWQLAHRADAARRCAQLGISVFSNDIESRADAKPAPAGFTPSDLAAGIAAERAAAPHVLLTYTGQDQPTLHGDHPWSAFDGVDFWFPEVYGDVARYLAHVASWQEARKLGMVSGALVVPYVLGAGVPASSLSWMIDPHPCCGIWVAGCSKADDAGALDLDGEMFIEDLNALYAQGFVGFGRVTQFQQARGLRVDGRIGPATRKALRGV